MSVLAGATVETVFDSGDHDPRGVAMAREVVATWLDRHDADDALRDDLVLIASELVTNAVCDTGGRVRVTIGEVLGGVKLQVFDEALDLPNPRVAGRDDTSGRGLAIVAAVANAWGAHHTVDDDLVGKVVWATCLRR